MIPSLSRTVYPLLSYGAKNTAPAVGALSLYMSLTS